MLRENDGFRKKMSNKIEGRLRFWLEYSVPGNYAVHRSGCGKRMCDDPISIGV